MSYDLPGRLDKLAKLLAIIPVIVFWTFANVLISSALASVVFVQLLVVAGWSKGLSMGVAVLTATAVMVYIWLQPNIRRYISARSQNR